MNDECVQIVFQMEDTIKITDHLQNYKLFNFTTFSAVIYCDLSVIYNSPSELFHFERFDVIIARRRC